MTRIYVSNDKEELDYTDRPICYLVPINSAVQLQNTGTETITLHYSQNTPPNSLWVAGTQSTTTIYPGSANKVWMTTSNTPVTSQISTTGSFSKRSASIKSGLTLDVSTDIDNPWFHGAAPPGTSITFQNPTSAAVTVSFNNPDAWQPVNGTAPSEITVPANNGTVTLKTSKSKESTAMSTSGLTDPTIHVPKDVSNRNFLSEIPPNVQVTFNNMSNATRTVYFRNANFWQEGVSSIDVPGSDQITLTTLNTNAELSTEMSLTDHWDNAPHATLKIRVEPEYATITVSN